MAGKEESTPSPAAMCIDSVTAKEIPRLPDDVVRNVFSNLGKEDLLNCRLVSNSWHKQALYQLGKSGHVQKLDCSNLPDYIKFCRTSSAQIPLPFKISGEGHINWRSMAVNVNTLLQLAGPESINKLQLIPANSLEGVGVSILEKAAPGLVSLTLSPKAFISSRMGPSVSFPKLKSLTISTTFYHDDDELVHLDERRELEFYSNLIEKCPVLEHLDCSSASLKLADGLELKIPFEHLKSLSFYTTYPTQIESTSELVLAQIKSRPAIEPKIEIFEIDLDTETGTTTELLEEFSPTLKTLTYVTADYKYLDNEQFTLPVLPYLQHLNMNSSLGHDDMQYPIHLKTGELNVNPESLPSLKSVSLPFGLYWDGNTCFSTVEHINLNLYVQDTHETLPIPNLSITSVAAFVDNLFRRYPNATQLCLTKCGVSPNQEMYIKRVITAILEAESAKWLQKLIILDYEVDYLGDVLHGLDLQSGNIPLALLLTKNSMEDVKTAVRKLFGDLGMTDIKKVKFTEKNGCHFATYGSPHVLNAMEKIQFSSRGKMNPFFQLDFNDESGSELSTKKFLRLDMYNKYMPNLRSLEMSPNMLSTKGRADAWRVARQIEAKYPNWTVDLI